MLRLVAQTGLSNASSNIGRLEIFINGQWGTICDDSFSVTDATAACVQLGFNGAATFTSSVSSDG